MNAVITFDNIGVLCAFFGSVVFLLGYSIMAAWWHHPIGRAVAFLDAGLAIALAPSMLHLVFHLNILDQFFAWYYGGSLYLVTLITLWRLAVIFRVQRSATPRFKKPRG